MFEKQAPEFLDLIAIIDEIATLADTQLNDPSMRNDRLTVRENTRQYNICFWRCILSYVATCQRYDFLSCKFVSETFSRLEQIEDEQRLFLILEVHRVILKGNGILTFKSLYNK